MSGDDQPEKPGRRQFLAVTATVATAAAVAPVAAATQSLTTASGNPPDAIAFWGEHQAGIATPQQKHVYFAAFDLSTDKRDDVIALLRQWTDAAARLTQGQSAEPLDENPEQPAADSGEALGLASNRLTLTFGFGPGLFGKDGNDRYSLARHRPEALVDLPRFNGDQLVPERTGGDLCIQACADDPQVAFHAVRQLARIGYDSAKLRWSQPGFLSGGGKKDTPRNLMGFKDGTMSVPTSDKALMDQFVWAGSEDGWMDRGSYLVARPIRIALEHWDRMKLAFQEQVMGRHKLSGAPLGSRNEHDPLDLDATDKDGNPLIPDNSHVRLGAPAANDGAQMLRRSYSYDHGLSFTAERWPPWRQGMEFDAGLLFMCYQRDPRTSFIKIFENMAKFDMMNQFTTHIGGGLFACPPGAKKGGYVGQGLFELA